MQEQTRAQAYPRKRFFVEMFTRDISLIDCVSVNTDGLCPLFTDLVCPFFTGLNCPLFTDLQHTISPAS